jgi:outer membrane PBP1 activator LpoA protein
MLCAAIAIAFAAGALSCASVHPATRARVVAPVIIVEQAPGTAPSLPASPQAPPDIAPLPDGSPVPGGEATPLSPEAALALGMPRGGAPGTPAPPTTDLIALVLPLEEPAFARAAGAVRDGFLDAANAAGAAGNCIVIGHGRDGVLAAFDAARARGVRVAVGPLVRDDLKKLAAAAVDLPWTLALNQLDDGTRLPPAIYAFPLSVESDGRTLARRALAQGAHSIDVVEGDSPLMKRFAGSFAVAWTQGGGAAPSALRFDASPEALTDLRRVISRKPPDAVLLAVDGERAALVKPFIGGIAAYASGLVFERPSPALARDLDGVHVVEIPWLLTPDAPELAPFTRPEFDSDSLARLYALGIDAFRVADAFRDGPPARFSLAGATGRVTLGPGHEFQREGRLGMFRAGVLVPLDATP